MCYNIKKNPIFFPRTICYVSGRFSDQWRLCNILVQRRRFRDKSSGLSRCVVGVTVPDVLKHRRAFTLSQVAVYFFLDCLTLKVKAVRALKLSRPIIPTTKRKSSNKDQPLTKIGRSVFKCLLFNDAVSCWFCMGVKVVHSHWRRNVGWGCFRIRCWGEYLGLRRTR